MSQPPIQSVGYQPPQPYYQAELETLKGLKHINWGIILYIVATLLILMAALVIVVAVISLPSASDPDEILGPIVAMAALACGGLFIYFVTIILWLLGIYEMNKGKDEFGPKHSASVSRAVMLIVLFIILIVVSFLATTVLTFTGLTATTIDPDQFLESMRLALLIGGVIGIISTAALGLAIVYLILELCDEKYKKILWAAFIVDMILTIVGTAITIVVVYQDFGTVTDISELSTISNIGDLARGMSFIAFIMFLLAYRHAYKRVQSGEIQPVPGARSPMFPIPPPVQYQQQPPYQQQPYPQQPPYQQPPPGQPTMTCPTCGNPTSPGETFCANCGARLQ
jgi:hypothetical protein